ncbi:hypothetical protein HNV12_12305 [Methanococcoides sp. SA1]|nr:hypothetical protein [Methanococcoides sp. SA1]
MRSNLFRMIGIVAILLFLILSINVTASAAPNVVSEINAVRYIQGETIGSHNVPDDIFVSVTLTPMGGPAIGLALQEMIPEGWGLEPIDNDGGIFKSITLEWFWAEEIDEGGSRTVEYIFHVPASCNTTTSYEIAGVVSTFNIEQSDVVGEYNINIVEDWNPWDDPDSEGIPNGTYITISEVIDAYNCFNNTSPAPTGVYVTISDVIDMYNSFKNSTPMQFLSIGWISSLFIF